VSVAEATKPAAAPIANGLRGNDPKQINLTANPKVSAQQLPVDRSNSLADLAVRIRNEHKASTLAIKRGFAHAISAGTLLIEAKAHRPHGAWLPWLRDRCGVPERSAQRYMELAATRQTANPTIWRIWH